jgi:urease accessory protein
MNSIPPAPSSVIDVPPALTLMRVLQLASPALPVGAYAYSQGIEWLVEDGTLRTDQDVAEWLSDMLECGLARFDLPLISHSHAAWAADDVSEAARLNQLWLSGRESAELRAETVQMGYALRQLARDLRVTDSAHPAYDWPEAGLGAMFSLLAQRLAVPAWETLCAYAFGWLENQVLAAVKTIPLGQAAGQRLLLSLSAKIPAIAHGSLTLPEAQWENFQPGLAIASSLHETQYTRLFRS